MAHEFSFSDAACPGQHFCLTLPLRDYSIGHRILFMRQRNPLVFGDEEAFNELPTETKIFWLIESVSVCNQTYAHRIALEKSPTRWLLWKFKRDSKKWRKARAKSQSDFLKAARADTSRIPDLNEWWAVEMVQFRNYLNASRIITEFKARCEPFPFLPCLPMADAKGRSLGGPYEATLIQFLINSKLCADAAAVMEYPFALAEMHHLVHLEREGNLRIINAAELQFEQDAADHDLKSARDAGFKTVEEHVAHILAENEKRKEEFRNRKPEANNLATEVPEELKTDDAEISRRKAMKDYLPPGGSMDTVSVEPKFQLKHTTD